MRRGCRAVAPGRLQIEDAMATRGMGIRTAKARAGSWAGGIDARGRERREV
jgi:hypothetical protein